MPSDRAWEVVGRFLDLVRLLVVVGLIVAIGVGLLNLDATMAFIKDAIELLKAAR